MKRNLLFSVLLFVISAMVLGAYLRRGIDGYEICTFHGMIEGSAEKPFVTRMLVPFIIRELSSFVPTDVAAKSDAFGDRNIPELHAKTWNIRFTELVFAMLIWYASVIGFALVMMKIVRHLYVTNTDTLRIIALASVAGLPVFFKYFSYMYDLPHLMLFTLCLYLCMKQNWKTYLVFLAVTAFSKETAILIPLIFYLFYRNTELPKPAFRKLLAAQAAIFISVRAIIYILFLKNAGEFMEVHIRHNLTLEAYSLSQFLAFSFLVISVFAGWNKKPKILKCWLFTLVPLVLPALVFGFVDEYRDYYEAYPAILLLSAQFIAVQLHEKLFTLKPVTNEQSQTAANRASVAGINFVHN